MSEPSSYLKYLPPVLWQDEPAAPDFSLGAMLRIFEKILTGIPDGVSIPHDPVTAQIAGVDRLFGPWTAPQRFLPWLASWVALEFPALQNTQLWDEYQQRKVTDEIARIYRLRGSKAGLNLYLDLYAVGSTRPRVALDDGTRLLSVLPGAAGAAAVTGLVSQGPAVMNNTVSVAGMARPWCVAVSSDGSILVGDTAVPAGAPVPLKNCVWHLDPVGGYDLAGPPPRPQPVPRRPPSRSPASWPWPCGRPRARRRRRCTCWTVPAGCTRSRRRSRFPRPRRSPRWPRRARACGRWPWPSTR